MFSAGSVAGLLPGDSSKQKLDLLGLVAGLDDTECRRKNKRHSRIGQTDMNPLHNAWNQRHRGDRLIWAYARLEHRAPSLARWLWTRFS